MAMRLQTKSIMTGAGRAACGLLAAVVALGAAPIVTAAPRAEGPAALCADVVGLSPGEKHYAACVASLTESQRSLEDGAAMGRARRDCLARGYQPDTPALAECEVAARPTRWDDAAQPQSPGPGREQSYFAASRRDNAQREAMACAGLGLDPAGSAFGDCVADLRGALARASDPMM
jgi:hypothetical protein